MGKSDRGAAKRTGRRSETGAVEGLRECPELGLGSFGNFVFWRSKERAASKDGACEKTVAYRDGAPEFGAVFA